MNKDKANKQKKTKREEKYCKDLLPPLEEPTQAPAPAEAVQGLSLTDPQQLEEPLVVLLAPVSEDDSYPCPFQKAGSTHSSELLFLKHSDQHIEPSALLSGFLVEVAQEVGELRNRETAPEHSSPEQPRLAPIFTSMHRAQPSITPQTLGVTARVPMLSLTPLGLPNRHINTRCKLELEN